MKLVEIASRVTFYKAVPKSDLEALSFIPGTVTTSYNEAYQWWERYNSKKKNPKGPAKHLARSDAVIIKFDYDPSLLLSSEEFQRAGVSEHDRKSCWTSGAKNKAQINDIVDNYKIVLDSPKTI